MIKYSDYKRFFAKSGLFTLTGSDYTGYVEVLSGIPYVDNLIQIPNKCQTSSLQNRVQLDRLRTYETDLRCSEFFFDRAINDIITLPYSLNEMLIEANDFLNYSLLEDKLSKIKTNTIYTYSRCFIAGAVLPSSHDVVYAGVLDSTQTALSVLSGSNYNTLRFGDTYNFAYLDGIKGFAPINYQYNDNFSVVFAFTNTNLISLSCSDSSIGIIEVSPFYQTQTIENTLSFFSIGGIATVNNYLFVVDTGNNSVLKYDISGYINGDSVLSNKRNLLEIIGGRGHAVDGLLFNEPKEIAAGNNFIAINDSKNYVVKIYDLDFNFITKISGINFKTEALAAIEYNKKTNLLYIATYFNQTINLYVINECFSIEEVYTLPITISSSEIVTGMSFSYNNSNYFYVSTNYTVYKLLVNKPGIKRGTYNTNKLYANIQTPASQVTATLNLPDDGGSVVYNSANSLWNYVDTIFDQANYNWETDAQGLTSVVIASNNTSQSTISQITSANAVFGELITGYRVTPQSSNNDKVFLFTTSRIYFFKEPTVYKSVLKLDNFNNYGNTFTLNRNEYIQGSSLNKEFYKLVYDNINLKNNLVGRFTGAYNALGVFVFTDYNYNIDFSRLLSTQIDEYYVHDNEKNILGVFNRALSKIYELQLKIIELTATDKGSGVTPTFNTTGTSNTLVIE